MKGAVYSAALTASAMFILIPNNSFADDWVLVGDTDTATFEIKVGSFENSNNKNGEKIFLAMGRMTDKKSRIVDFYKWYVTQRDCTRGVRKKITLDLEGKYQFENDYVHKGGTVSSDIADILCEIGEKDEGKGV